MQIRRRFKDGSNDCLFPRAWYFTCGQIKGEEITKRMRKRQCKYFLCMLLLIKSSPEALPSLNDFNIISTSSGEVEFEQILLRRRYVRG